ncbi:MAG: fatty acid desaturase, partial [Caulobacteraceae bacterium]|nr:fatty acid desaturase [Caulobacteraceae bacterium]
ALHHLLPRLPYHHLGEAHRRLVADLGPGSAYHDASYASLPHALGRLLARAKAYRRPGAPIA